MLIGFALVLGLITPRESLALFDFLAEEGKELSEVAAYTAALSDLITEIEPDSEMSEHSKNLNSRIKSLEAEYSKTRRVGRDSTSLLSGPDMSNRRVSDNIVSLTRYIKRVKRLMATLGLLGTQGSIAINTAETNHHLTEIQKNQQTQLLLMAEAQIKVAEEEVEQRKKWDQFFETERSRTQSNAFRKH
jgi:hypothetical protein